MTNGVEIAAVLRRNSVMGPALISVDSKPTVTHAPSFV